MKYLKEMDLVIPKRPNFIRVYGTLEFILIRNFSIEELKQIGEEWTKALIEEATK